MVYLERFPEPKPHTAFAQRQYETVGSSGAGKALNLASLGWDSTLWALLGADAAGDRVRQALGAAGVELRTVLDPAGTMQHVNLMDAAGDRISIFANPGTLDLAVDPEVVVELAAGKDLVALTIFEHCRPMLAPLREAGARLWIDVHDYDGANPYHRDFIAAASHLQLSTVALPDWRGFAQSRVDAGTSTVVCTHGARGASIATPDGWVEVDPVPVAEVVDTNGAGDAFFAGFATSWLTDRDPERAGQAGALAAAAALAAPDLAPVRTPGA